MSAVSAEFSDDEPMLVMDMAGESRDSWLEDVLRAAASESPSPSPDPSTPAAEFRSGPEATPNPGGTEEGTSLAMQGIMQACAVTLRGASATDAERLVRAIRELTGGEPAPETPPMGVRGSRAPRTLPTAGRPGDAGSPGRFPSLDPLRLWSRVLGSSAIQPRSSTRARRSAGPVARASARAPVAPETQVGPGQSRRSPLARACYSCGEAGHRYSQCPRGPPTAVFCRRCGRKGKTLRTCPACSQEWQREGPYVAAVGRNVPREELRGSRRSRASAQPPQATAVIPVAIPTPPETPTAKRKRTRSRRARRSKAAPSQA